MSKVSAEEISEKLMKLLDELSALGVHSVILASFANAQKGVTFGMETNTSETIARSLLQAGVKKVDDMGSDDPPRSRLGSH